ncbi:DUF6265 family protein [Congregibacter litoralis]|uniref:DUF6265 domain-containing protein n=1 Tax=Congregibacter litoralis KT71 TaxID=314285 RepID=A4A7E2_9GAMM|nr:DUF6265 family protein [Congregibacter litoralis]EAQ98211.2 hypothetical protein KT71_03152 [Congregibacter litoralis KT71]
MTKRKCGARSVTALLMMLSTLVTPQSHAQDLDWLVGCWESFENYSKEVWVKNPDGTLLGFSASIERNDIAFYELLYIREVGGVLTYTAHPSGQNPAVFVISDRDEQRLVFENPQHDYPQRIVYEREGDALTAAISLLNGGRRLSFTQESCR